MLRANPQLENAVSQIQSDHRELACVITAASYASEAGGWPSLQLLTEPLNHDADQQLGDPRSEKRGPSSSLSAARLQGIPRNRELSVSVLVSVWLSAGSGTISTLSSWYGQPCRGRRMFNSLMMLAVEAASALLSVAPRLELSAMVMQILHLSLSCRHQPSAPGGIENPFLGSVCPQTTTPEAKSSRRGCWD
jgi:hypothetical protein